MRKFCDMRDKTIYHNILHTGMLLLAAFVWGMAFSAQSIGADYVEGWTFLAFRSMLAVLSMLPVVLIRGDLRGVTRTDWKAGIICGFFLCLASGLQQIGIAYTTAAKSGFITAMYVILVPVLGAFILHKKQNSRLWVCIALCVAGLYLLCMGSGIEGVSYGDILTLGSALCFACQILCVDHYVGRIGAVKLTFLQFVTETVIAVLCMFLFEHPSMTAIRRAAIPILYAGVMSSAVGYSLQAVGQKDLDPAVASLAMCMESVFSAIGGWVILGQKLSLREGLGCALMFCAIVLAQVPVGEKRKAPSKTRKTV